MGYSIAVTARSKNQRDKMMRFLNNQDFTWSTVSEKAGHPIDPDYDCTYECFVGKDIFCKGKTSFGYYYNAGSSGAREWAWTLLRFAALRVGKKRSCVVSGVDGKHSLPYIMYDDHEVCPVLLRGQWESLGCDTFMVDENGYAMDQKEFWFMSEESRDDLYQAMKTTLQDMSEKWEDFK